MCTVVVIALLALAVSLRRLDDAGQLEEEWRNVELAIAIQHGNLVDQLLLRVCIVDVPVEQQRELAVWSALVEVGSEVATARSGECDEMLQERVRQRLLPQQAQRWEVVERAARSVVVELLAGATALQRWLARCVHEPSVTVQVPVGCELADQSSERIQTDVSRKQVDGDRISFVCTISVLVLGRQPEALAVNLK